jgi:multiple sugar transport system permease protein
MFTEGLRMWPSTATLDNFREVHGLRVPAVLPELCPRLAVHGAMTALIAAGGGYAFSRFEFRGSAGSRRCCC